MKEKKLFFRRHMSSNGCLCSYGKAEGVPFAIKRIFTVWAKRGAVRGMHAHKKCHQLLICVHGRISVACDNGQKTTRFTLRNEGEALYSPPKICAEQRYLDSKAVMIVLCSRKYEEKDYIRNYKTFLKII